MKKEVETNVVATGGMGKTVSYGVKGEGLAHIFGILRNQLYSDKISAVIREYTCNAIDANTENGKGTTPIQVTLPSLLEPTFKVRDFGKGLSQADIENIFCFYGHSTKSDSNSYIGQLGIGSKSAFAYSDSYNIVSYIKGTRHVYLSYIDDSQLGVISAVGSDPTTEEDGLEIVIPVKKNDVNAFQAKALSAFVFYPVRPTIIGRTKFYEELDIALGKSTKIEGEGWTIYQNFDAHRIIQNRSNCNISVLMGAILYPVDGSASTSANKFYNDAITSDAMLVIKADIGDVSIAASREGLEYNKKTQAFIDSRLTQITSELAKEINEKIGKAPDCLDASNAFWGIGKALSLSGVKYNYNHKGISLTMGHNTLQSSCLDLGSLYPKRSTAKAGGDAFDCNLGLFRVYNTGNTGSSIDDRDIQVQHLATTTSNGRVVAVYAREVHSSRFLFSKSSAQDIKDIIRTLSLTHKFEYDEHYLFVSAPGAKTELQLAELGLRLDRFTDCSTVQGTKYARAPSQKKPRAPRNTTGIISSKKGPIKQTNQDVILKDLVKRLSSEDNFGVELAPTDLDLKKTTGYCYKHTYNCDKSYGNLTNLGILLMCAIGSKKVDASVNLVGLGPALCNAYRATIAKTYKPLNDFMKTLADLFVDPAFREPLEAFIATHNSKGIINLIQSYPKIFIKDVDACAQLTQLEAKAQEFIKLVTGGIVVQGKARETLYSSLMQSIGAFRSAYQSSLTVPSDLALIFSDLHAGKLSTIGPMIEKVRTKYKSLVMLLETEALVPSGRGTYEWRTRASSPQFTVEDVLETCVNDLI